MNDNTAVNTPDLIRLDECRILWVVNYDEKTGTAFLKLQHEKEGKFFAAGVTCSINPGAFYSVTGRWRETRKGKLFMFKDFVTLMPNNKKTAIAFLTCKGFCKGVSKKTICNIVDELGDNAISIIKNNPEQLDHIKGVGKTTKEKIVSAVQNAAEAEAVFNYLYHFGINAHDAFTLYCKYGEATIAQICTNPYGVAEENDYIYSFATADNIALHHGLDAYAPFRIRAGILEAMRSSTTQEGHSYLSEPETVRRTVSMLSKLRPNETDAIKVEEAVKKILPELVEEGAVIKESYDDIDCLYLPEFANAEQTVAERLQEIAQTPLDCNPIDNNLFNNASNIKFSDEQTAAINGALTSSFCIITGGPGSGKSLIMSEIVRKHIMAGHTVKLAAPTAKAADRMEELTGLPATTLQRLLGYRPFKGYLFNHENPIRADVVIIDEFSMVDIILMKDLVQAIHPGTSFIAIGDADQLPSVGAGNVFADLIKSRCFPVYRLTKIFRQAAGTSIAENAKLINTGVAPHSSADFKFCWCTGDKIQDALRDIVFDKIPKYSLIPSSDIKIITPLREGDRGSLAYSRYLREGFNPSSVNPQYQKTFCGFRVGDKVMQTKNDYKLGAMNGDEGVVEAIDASSNRLTIRFKDDKIVNYSRNEAADELEFSYVITVHKSQGSEYPAVVIALPPESGQMMNRRLLYTAVTRAKKMVVIIGSKDAANLSISKYTEINRNSNLALKLRKAAAEATETQSRAV